MIVKNRTERMAVMRSKILVQLVVIGLIFTLAGCGGAKDSNPLVTPGQPALPEAVKTTNGQKNIALVMKTLTNPFFVEMEKGARRAEQEFGANLIVKTGAQETSIDQQIVIIEDLIRMKVDAIVIAPASSIDLIPALKKAQEAKISIINIDNQLDAEVARKVGLVDVPFISVDNERSAYLAGKFISSKLAGPTEVLVLEGIRGARNAQERTAGALRAFKENPNAKIVAVETANWKIDEAYAVTQSQFSQRPAIGAVFCGNDMMALGVVKYLTEVGRKDVWVAGFDALDEAKKAVRDGSLAVTVDQQAEQQGYLGVKMALQKIKGERLLSETMVDAQLILGGK
jgi:ribose transport system substrate-binding protein